MFKLAGISKFFAILLELPTLF